MSVGSYKAKKKKEDARRLAGQQDLKEVMLDFV
jgi:hypothetical protein